jgi:transposase
VDAMYRCVCGLDVHKKIVVACVRLMLEGGKMQQEVRTFGTMTRDLLALADWMAAAGVTHVAMELRVPGQSEQPCNMNTDSGAI